MTKEKVTNNLRCIIEWSVITAVFMVPLYFAWFHENYTVFDLNKSALLRLCLSVAAIAWFGLLAWRGKISALGSKKVFWSAMSFLAAAIISTALSLHPMISLLGSYERQQGFHNIIAYVLLFLFIAVFFKSAKHIKRLVIVLHISAALICAYGIMQLFGWDFLSWAQSSMSRIFSSFGQPNFFGHYIAVMIPISLYGFFQIAKRWYTKLFYALLLAAEIVCLIFTYSRSAWIALALALGLSAVLVLWKKNKKKTAAAIVIVAVASIIALLLPPVRSALLTHSDYVNLKFSSRLVSILDFNNGSNAIRLKYWKAALNAFSEATPERYLFGFGPDVQSSVYVDQYQIDWGYYERLNSYPDRAHNGLLDLLLQFGIVGAAAFFALVWFSIRGLFKVLDKQGGEEFWLAAAFVAALIAYAANNMFSFSLTAMAMMLFTLLGLSFVLGGEYTEAPEKSLHFFQPASRWVIGTALSILLAVIFYAVDIRPLVADYYYIQVKRGEARQDCRKVLENMETVMEWYPQSHYYARAYLSHAVNCFAAVGGESAQQQVFKNIIDQALLIPKHEQQFFTLLDLAHAYSILGYYKDPSYYSQAELYYRELIGINKNITVAYQDLGRMKLWQAKFAEARQIFEQGIAVTPTLDKAFPGSEHTIAIAKQLGYFYNLIGLAHFEEKDYASAKVAYVKALEYDPLITAALKKLADMAYTEGDKQKAISYNKQAFNLEPQEALWPVSLATLYRELGDLKQARSYANQAAALDPSNEQVKELVKDLNR